MLSTKELSLPCCIYNFKRNKFLSFIIILLLCLLLNGCKCGPASSIESPIIESPIIENECKLLKPSNLEASAVTYNQIYINWDDKSNNEDNFIVERASSNEGPFSEIATLNANTIVWYDNGLEPETTYYYQIKASNSSTDSEYSNIADATTLSMTNTTNKWGGFSGIRNPISKYETNTATSSDRWAITDTSKSWTQDEFTGSILQPNTETEVYFLIKSNTIDTITVFGNDIEEHEEQCNRYVSDENDGNCEYAILDRWSVQKVNSRWWLFDPFGNAFFIKSINGMDVEINRYGYDIDGNTFANNMRDKHGVTNDHDAILAEMTTLKEMGFNCLGETLDHYRAIPGHDVPSSLSEEQYLPFISQVRIAVLYLSPIESFEVNGADLWDATDPNFQVLIEELLQAGESRTNVGPFYILNNQRYWDTHFLTPYRYAKYRISANPYFIGFDWDEESKYLIAEHTNEHMGYHIITSPGTSHRKLRACTYLQTVYSSISELNSSWGSGFSSWTALQNAGAGQIDPLLSSTSHPTNPYKIWDYGEYNETNTNMKDDLDDVAEDFWRIYCRKVKDALDNSTAVHMLNFGPGYGGSGGDEKNNHGGAVSPRYLFRGSVSEDKSEKYIDIIGVTDPMHCAHTDNTNTLAIIGPTLKERYNEVGLPYWHESCWTTAEADSAVSHTGTVDLISDTVMTDNGANFNTANDWETSYHSKSRCWILFNPDTTIEEERMYFRIAFDGAEENTLTVDLAHGPADNWFWEWSPDMTSVASVGDPYVIITHDKLLHISDGYTDQLFIPLTQEERAAFYVQFLNDITNFQADNGDYIDVGFSQWEFFDYGYRSGAEEIRNWGFMTIKGNLYDGSANIANGEIQDCGNFVVPVKTKLNNLYNDILSP